MAASRKKGEETLGSSTMIVCLPRRVNRFFAILVAAIVLSFPGCNVAPVTAQTVSPLAVEARSLPDVLEKVAGRGQHRRDVTSAG